jgi:hypothetical protein
MELHAEFMHFEVCILSSPFLSSLSCFRVPSDTKSWMPQDTKNLEKTRATSKFVSSSIYLEEGAPSPLFLTSRNTAMGPA